MTVYYCRNGETFNGDGSTNAAAASDGAAGAFNSLKDQITSGVTSISPGDTLIIKSTDTDGTSDVVVVLTASLIWPIGTNRSDSGVRTYIIDNGDEWPGAVANVIITLPNTSGINIVFSDFLRIKADPSLKNLIFRDGYTGSSSQTPLKFSSVAISGFKVEFIQPVGFCEKLMYFLATSGSNLEDFIFDQKAIASSSSLELFFYVNGNHSSNWRNFELNYTGANIITTGMALAKFANDGIYLTLTNGKITGVEQSNYLCASTNTIPQVLALNVQTIYIENLMWAKATSEAGDDYGPLPYAVANIPDGSKSHGFVMSNSVADSSWDGDGNYPILNAILPDGSGWSIKSYFPMVAPGSPHSIFRTTKTWNAGNVLLDIKVEMLLELKSPIGNDVASFTDEDIYLCVSYIDATTSEIKMATTKTHQNASTLTASSSTWTPENLGAPYYGAVSFSKKKIEYSTPTTVKDGTDVGLELLTVKRSPDSSGIMFIDPDIILTDAT